MPHAAAEAAAAATAASDDDTKSWPELATEETSFWTHFLFVLLTLVKRKFYLA